MSALADKVATTPAKSKGLTGQTYSAWGPTEIALVSDLGSGQSYSDEHVYPLHATRDYKKITGAYNAYASAFMLAQKALKAHGRTDVTSFFTFTVKAVEDGVTFTITAK